MCCSNNSSRLNEENCDHDDVWISDLNEHRFLWLNYFSILTLVCLTNREKFMRQCRRLLWVKVVFTVAWLKLKVFQCRGRKQHKHKHMYSFFLVPCCWITFNLNLRKAKLLLPIMPIGIVAYAFTLPWDNLCRNSCMSDTRDSVWHLELCQKCSVMRHIFNSILTVWKMWSNTVFCVWYNYNYLKHIHL